jgi:hypothetical protein
MHTSLVLNLLNLADKISFFLDKCRRIQFLEKVPSSIEHGAEKNSNVFEKYLSQVTAGRASRYSDSNVMQAGAMYFNVLCRSGLVSRALYSLLFKYFQVITSLSLSLSLSLSFIENSQIPVLWTTRFYFTGLLVSTLPL